MRETVFDSGKGGKPAVIVQATDIHFSAVNDKDLQEPFYKKTDMKEGDAATEQIYDLIRNNADVIKGTFCGHQHFDYYTEIVAKTADGKDTIIPQYIMCAAYRHNGHLMKITVK